MKLLRGPGHHYYNPLSTLSFLKLTSINKPTKALIFPFHKPPYSPLYSSSSSSLSEPSIQTQPQPHPWPEWVTFVDRLKSLGYFPPSLIDKSSLSYGEINVLKDPCLSFARDRYDLFGSFTKDDIQSLVEVGCPIIQRKVVNSAKRLRVYVGLEEKSVCDICHLKGSCDRAYVILGESEGVARMVDLMRLLLSYALDPLLISGTMGVDSNNQAESSSRKVLNLLIELTETSKSQAPREFSKKVDHVKKQSINFLKDSSPQDVQRNMVQDVEKKGDWACPKCNFMNFSRNYRCHKCNEENPKWVSVDIEMKKGDWKCLQCGVVNFASRKNCFCCKDPRPPRALNPGEWECSKCDFLNFRRNTTCFKCGSNIPRNRTVA